jgi:hypothetical protein
LPTRKFGEDVTNQMLSEMEIPSNIAGYFNWFARGLILRVYTDHPRSPELLDLVRICGSRFVAEDRKRIVSRAG